MASSYSEVYASWQNNPEGFWMEQAEAIDWFTEPTTAFDPDQGVYGGWYPDGITNTCHNCLDRHVAAGRGEHDQAAPCPAVALEPQRAPDLPQAGREASAHLAQEAAKGRAQLQVRDHANEPTVPVVQA